MKRILLGWLVVIAAAAQTTDPKASALVAETLAALGGDAFLNMVDRVEYGRAYSFYQERLSGLAKARISVRYLKEGSPALEERQAFGNNEDSGFIFSGGKGWSFSFRGARPVREEILARWTDSTLRNVFYIFRMRMKEPGMTFEYRGRDVFENQPVELLDIIDAENRVVTAYIHMSTRLPVRQVYIRRDPKTKERLEEVTLFSKYRDVGGGVQWPYTLERYRNGEKIFEMYAESVTINQNLSPDLFRVEGKFKILPPAK